MHYKVWHSVVVVVTLVCVVLDLLSPQGVV